jgi:hypothetical protein
MGWMGIRDQPKSCTFFLSLLNAGFGPMNGASLCGLQQELDLYSFEWKNDAAIVRAIEDSGVK